MKKNTYAICNKLLQKSLSFILLSANFIFAADSFAFFSNSALTTSFIEASFCTRVSFLNCSKSGNYFSDSTAISAQNLFLDRGKRNCAADLGEEIKNSDTINHNQIGVFFGEDRMSRNFAHTLKKDSI